LGAPVRDFNITARPGASRKGLKFKRTMPKRALRWALLVPWLLLAGGTVILLRLGQPAVAPTPVPSGPPGSAAEILRYRLDPDRFIVLEISPGTPGQNTIRATVLDRNLQPVAAGGLGLRLWRLDRDDPPADLPAAPGSPAIEARLNLEPGWWALEASLSGGPAQTFYLLVGSAAPADAAPDQKAFNLLNRAIDAFGRLTAVRWEEQLTSGLPYPTRAGGWVLTEGEAQAPDRLHLRISADGAAREVYQVGGRRCDREGNGPWQCADVPPANPFDRSAFRAATGVWSGRTETIAGEPARVIFFYYPPAEAWYAWWVGEQTGYLLQEVMVAPGHIMATRYFDQNVPANIGLPIG
jgi:hypothetical protein